jgi:hypothetical protein
MYVCIRVYTRTHIDACVCMCMYVCMYVRAEMYKHSRNRTQDTSRHKSFELYYTNKKKIDCGRNFALNVSVLQDTVRSVGL